MRFITALVNLVLLICPCALCYGQVSFSSIVGEGGYGAFKGAARWEMDNGIAFVPFVGYYRPSDSEEDEEFTMGKGGVEVRYDTGNSTAVFLWGDFVPMQIGFERISYQAGMEYQICYHCGVVKNLYMRLGVGQVFYKVTKYVDTAEYPGGFHAQTPLLTGRLGTELGPMELQFEYEKLIKYSHQPPEDIMASWTDIPLMTTVTQGYVSNVFVGKWSYHTRLVSPYVIWGTYKYVVGGRHKDTYGAGLSLHWNKVTVSGGIENIASNWEDSRQNYFSLSASTEF